MRTLVKMRVSQAAFSEIAEEFRKHGYDHVFMTGGQINMDGIALERDPDRALPPSVVEIDANDLDHDAFRRIYGLDHLGTNDHET
ncbi:hypothetical protein BRAO375_3660040 [Bradyrhizobium sp. ORS 375]|uniref:hypothetical protein n=1 Tax=Bradyrhizobium sp. (strain ORS 375) TaxID=566679 RepID=UPI0002406988|nr:hypothetical protein [Bradyrhizobium sp. ORS 375]CCD94646.1 hypothetical protein BRAO375_3660040 [Bradyrhizobium sp. ORS 375]